MERAFAGHGVRGRHGGQQLQSGTQGYADGDVDCDGDVALSDYSYIHAGIGSCAAQSKYISHLRADLDHDGCITLVDYQMWLEAYRQANGRDFVPPNVKTPIPVQLPHGGAGVAEDGVVGAGGL